MNILRRLRRNIAIWTISGLWSFVLPGCEQKMADQPRYDPLESSRLFADGMSARPIIAGTIARGELPADSSFVTGVAANSGELPAPEPSLDERTNYLEAFPLNVNVALIERGRQRYSIYCSPCHGANGTGTGPVVQRGYPPAQSFHTDRLKQAPVGYLYDVVTRGYQKMPAFGNRIPPDDRWKIIAYIRTLELAGEEPIADSLDQFIDQLPVSENAVDVAYHWQTRVPTDAGSGRFVVGREEN